MSSVCGLGKFASCLAFGAFFALVGSDPAAATTRNATTYTELTTALAGSTSGDTINITADIVVTSSVTVSASVTLIGNGHTVTVPTPGMTEAGLFAGSPSSFRVFSIGSGVTVAIKDMTIKGGNAQGAALYNGSTTSTVTLTGVTISNNRYSSSGGGAIYNAGTLILRDCRVIRNSASYGGGFLNTGSSAKMFVESSTFAENYSESSSGGGGAAENNSSATLYINNSTFANNTATETGGAINNYGGTLWVLNSTFTGNVGVGLSTGAGAINTHSGSATAYLVNNLFAYNYVTNSTSNPTTLTNPSEGLRDVRCYGGTSYGGTINAYYNVFQGTTPECIGTSVGNVSYGGDASGSNNSLFSNGISTRILSGSSGYEIGTLWIFRPLLVTVASNRLVTLQTNSFSLEATNLGVKTAFKADGSNIGYHDGTNWVSLKGTASDADLVTSYQDGATRPTANVRGATNSVVDNVYMLKVVKANNGSGVANGSVSGGSLYGDVYASGTSVTITAFANTSYAFSAWNVLNWGSSPPQFVSDSTTDNPRVVTVAQNTVLQPVFVGSSSFTVTYIGNDNTGGSAPSPQTSSSSVTLSGPSTLAKTGYTFNNWNTNSNGSGTAYTQGSSYSGGSGNLTLYAQWSAAAGQCGSGSGGTFTSPPATNLCTNSTASSVATGNTAYSWTCAGGASTASCSATRNYVISTSASNGTITPSSAQVAYNGTSQFAVAPNSGYAIQSVSGCGGSLSGSTYTTGSVTADCTVTASFVSTNASLSALMLSSGTLSPSFAAATTSYTVSVANSVTSITITPTVADSTATVTVNGTAVTSGSASGAISLSVGDNTVTLEGTAQDGTTKTTYTVTVTRAKTDQTISFTSTAPATAVVGGTTYSPTATSTSGLTVTLTIDGSASSVCSISGGVVSFASAGTCKIDANQAGDASFNAAAQVQQSFTVGQGTQATLTATATPASIAYAATSVLATTGGSGTGAVSYAVTTGDGYCSVSVATLTGTGIGSCTVTATKAADANYNATTATVSVAVGQESQTIVFDPAPTVVTARTGTVSAKGGGSGNPVVFSSLSPAVCTVSGSNGGTVTGVTTGTCTIAANQTGSTEYAAAPQATQDITVVAPIAGACGSANGTTVTSPPASGLCSVGTPSAVTEVSAGRYSWNCAGIDYGPVAMCSAGQGGGVIGPGGGTGIELDTNASAGCSVTRLNLIPPPGNGPAGQELPYGVADFKLACTGTTVTIQLTYPNSVEGMQLWKYGAYPDASGTVQWYVFPNAVISGKTIAYSITDNGLGDSDPTSGSIADPAGPGRPAATGGEVSIATVSSPTGGGTVTCAPNPIPAGSSATCTASANSGFTFGRFSDNCVRTSGASCVVRNVSGSITVTAFFDQSPVPYATLRVARTGNGGGAVTSAPGGINCGPVPSCSGSFWRGSSMTLTATPFAGSAFAGWSGGCGGNLPTCSLTLSADTGVTANFRYGGTAASYHLAQDFYIAYYGRPAEPEGQAYWAGQADLAGGFNAVVNAFGSSGEFTRRYGGMSNEAMVTKIYQQTLHRNPDAAGLAWYLAELQAGRQTFATIALAVLNGATKPPDSTVITNKGDVADHYTAKVLAGCAYGGEQTGVDALSAVTADPATVMAAKAAVDRRCGP